MAAWHGIPGGTTVAVAMGDLQCSIYAAQPTASDASMVMIIMIIIYPILYTCIQEDIKGLLYILAVYYRSSILNNS